MRFKSWVEKVSGTLSFFTRVSSKVFLKGQSSVKWKETASKENSYGPF